MKTLYRYLQIFSLNLIHFLNAFRFGDRISILTWVIYSKFSWQDPFENIFGQLPPPPPSENNSSGSRIHITYRVHTLVKYCI